MSLLDAVSRRGLFRSTVLLVTPVVVLACWVGVSSAAAGVIRTIPLGGSPEGVSSDGTDVWVTNDEGAVNEIEASSGTVIRTIPVGDEPAGVSADGAHVWVANESGDTVSEIEASSGAVIRTIPVVSSPWRVSSDGTHVWVTSETNENEGTVSEIEASSGAVIRTIRLGSPDGVSSDGTDVWVTDYYGDTVSEIEASSGTVIRTIPVGSNPAGVSADGAHVWVANDGEGTVSEIDASTGILIRTILVGEVPEGVSSDGAHVWVAQSQGFAEGMVSEIEASSGAVVHTIPVGLSPDGVSSDGKHVWVANRLVSVRQGQRLEGSVSELEAGEAPVEGLPVNTSPPEVSGLAKQGQTLVLTHGTWTREPFDYSDQWLRCDSSGGGCQPIKGATADSYLLTGADVGHTIRVQETASNGSGEAGSVQAAATVPVQPLELQAQAGESVTTTVGETVTLDGSASTPDSEIESYRWEFGDGEVEEGPADAIVHHVYRHVTPEHEPLAATLTVSRGGETSKAAMRVTVLAAPQSSEALTVTARDPAGHSIAGTEILYVGPNGSRQQVNTDSSGEALLAGLPQGMDTIYAYKAGYRPATGQASVDADHQGASSVTLESGEVATTGLSSHEMTLMEVEKAGIDPSAPANQNVYEFETKLAFTESSVPPVELHEAVNSDGQFVGIGEGGEGGEGGGSGGGAGGGGGAFGASGGGGDWSCSPTQCEMTPPVTGEGDRIVAVPEVVEGHPLIQWLILKGKAAVLKQFFEVTMVTQNLSSESFTLTDGSATLNVPEGMSLAPTPAPQSATQPVADIPGGGSATTNWIVRGDKPGEYLISAAYDAKLQPFAAPVEVLAGLASPLHVWGANALQLRVLADSGALAEGVPYHVSIGVTNRANVPLYNVGLSIEEEPHEHFIFQPGQRFSEQLGELAPGQTAYIKHPYILVPDGQSQSIFNPALSSASFVGEVAHPGAGIEAVEPPALYGVAAPPDTPGLVHLHWQHVPDAEGYEVFSTPSLDTPFKAASPVLESPGSSSEVTLLPDGATDAYLKPPAQSQRYAVSAVIEGHLTLASRVIPATATAQAAEFRLCVAQKKGEYTEADCKSKSAKAKKGKFEWKPGPAPSCVAQKKGEYTSSSCTTKSAKAKKGTYEKAPGPGYSSATGTVTLEAPGLARKVICAASSATGEITGLRTGLERVTFTGCESSGEVCASEGPDSSPSGKTGVIVTNLLQSKLAEPVVGKVWLELSSAQHEPYLLEFGCGGQRFRTQDLLSGVQAGNINFSSLTSTTTFAPGEGEQALYSELSENSGASWAGPDPTSLVATATNTAATKIEIKT